MQEGDFSPTRRKQEDKNSEAENITMKGERGREQKGARKIKNVSRAEAGRKPPVGLSAGKLTSNCL